VLQAFFGDELPLDDLDCRNIDVLLHKLPREFVVDRQSRNGKHIFMEYFVVFIGV